ncbi:hypothetical protein [Streptomyces sp. NPDC048438]|uniref:hypothetical protein n=1 Tax=Streptomyces sp. NPDC048438 TaxID=3365551 RepID=UPI003718D65B
MPRARVVPLFAPLATYTVAVERDLTGAGIATSSTGQARQDHRHADAALAAAIPGCRDRGTELFTPTD